MNKLILKLTDYKKWLIVGALALILLIYPVLASAPSGTNMKSTVLGTETLSPLGLPVANNNPLPPTLHGTLNFEGVKAKSFLVYDVNSNSVLAEQSSNQPLAIASVTKLMTALVVYNNTASFKKTVLITGKDVFTVDPSLGLKPGDEVTYNDLFYSMLVGSANDAALTLANHVETETGQNFVNLMNQTAKDLGMDNTHFSNPLGFDSEANYSTTGDLHKLVQALGQYQAFSLVGKNQSYSFTSVNGTLYTVRATNKLIQNNKDLYAIKTGYTDLAQGSMITEVREPNHAFIIILLDSSNRENDTLILKSQILNNYSWPN